MDLEICRVIKIAWILKSVGLWKSFGSKSAGLS